MPAARTFLANPRFLVASLLGSLVAGVTSIIATLPTQIAILGVLVSILVGVVLTLLDEQVRRDVAMAELSAVGKVVEVLQDEPELARMFRRIGDAFVSLSEQSDAVFRSAVATKLLSVAGELELMARGTIAFRGTESWRTVYQELLKSASLRLYRSVAWVKCSDYWQDAPGRQSIRDNNDAINRGVIVERIFIFPREFWPADQLLPSENVMRWIMDQHNHRVWVMLCLESEIESEPGLPLDFGIYGDLAVGTQSLDEECRTREFLLEFNTEAVKLAEDRWQRLKLHAIPLRTLLDGEGVEG